MKILIIGSNGMLGSSLISEFFCSSNNIVGISRTASTNHKLDNFYQIDFMEPAFEMELEKINEFFMPDIVINCSGLTSLADCEDNFQKAKHLNGDINKYIARAFNKSRHFYISTDSVFDGNDGNYNEQSKKIPLNKYAESKSYGEEICLSYSNSIFILRTNIYGLSSNKGPSIVNWAISAFKEDRSIDGFDDFMFNPLHTSQVAIAIKCLYQSSLKGNHIFHIGSAEHISKYKFLNLIKENFLNTRSDIRKVNNLTPSDRIERPKNTTLDTSKFELAFKNIFLINDGIKKIF